MDEDFPFNASVMAGCLIGAVTGYRLGNLVTALDWLYFGFAAGIVCAVALAEIGYLINPYNTRGARTFDRFTPLITIGILVPLASLYWK